MDDQLKSLKKLSHEKAFPGLTLTDELRQNIYEEIHKAKEKDEDILLAIFQLLNEKKTGFELLSHLRSRGIKKFNKNEGFLYALLHSLEQKGYIEAQWQEDEDKYYILHSKGKKMLYKLESKSSIIPLSLQEIWKGAMRYG